jgi:xanthine dehydrogenase accessory factor
LGWQTVIATDANSATGEIAGLSSLDNVVVMIHELEVAGQALVAALSSDAGYIGALGSHKMQETRAEWLAYRGFADLERVHGPAGLNIGAKTPAEIAVSILAEALAVIKLQSSV